MKKLFLILMSCMVMLAFTSAVVEAKPSIRSYKAPSGSYKAPATNGTTPAKPGSNGVSSTNSGTSSSTKTSTTGTTTNANRGFFSGGSFMKGMLIGGLAGMLFGGMFGGMGVFGNLLGLMVNVFAIFLGIMLIRGIFAYFAERRRLKKRYE